MTEVSTLTKFHFGDMVVEYLVEKTSRLVSLRLYPSALDNQLADHRETIGEQKGPAWRVESLVQFKLLVSCRMGIQARLGRQPAVRSFSNLCKEIGEKEFIVAIAWTLANPVVSSAIVGIRTVEHLDGLRNYNWIGQL